LLSVESGEKKQLTFPSSGPGDFFPAFSPDGKTLAGGNPSRLTFDERSSEAAWTPDGREIIFSQLWYRGALYRISVDGGSALPLTEGGQLGFSPSISRHGKRLVYSEGLYDTDIWRFELVASNDKVPLPTRLIFSSQQEDTPQFSPDGTRITFNSNRSGSFEIWVSDRAGRNPVQLTFFGGPYVTGTPRWSPDSKLIAFDSRPKGPSDIFVVSAEGGAPRCLTEESSDDLVPSWSRDGRWIYFGSDRSGKGDWQIWRIPIEGGKALQVTRRGGFEGLESFDGTFLYYSKSGSNDLWRVSLKDGEESLFLKNVAYRYWTVVQHGIYFVANEDEQPHIHFIDFVSRQVSRIAPLERKLVTNNHRGLAVSPDGRSLLVTLVEQDSSDIILVENFR
jgi:Tol biopolymer transport system component